MVPGLCQKTVDEGVGGPHVDPGEVCRDVFARDPSVGSRLKDVQGQDLLTHLVDDNATDRHTGGSQLSDGVDSLLDRHLLEQGHQVHSRLGRFQHCRDRVGLGSDRPDPGQVCDFVVDVQEAHHPAGRWGVYHDGVVGGCSAGPLGPVVPAAADRLINLAGKQDIAHAGRDRRGEVDGAEFFEQPAGTTELVVHLKVFQQGCLGVH